MEALTTLLRSKVGIAVLGAVLLGGLGAYMGAASAWRPSQLPSGSVANTGAAAIGTTSPSATSTGSAGKQTRNPSPTNTPGSSPTTPPVTPVSSGQTVDLHGTIGTINTTANSFTLNNSGSLITVVVNGQTAFQGSASSLQGLRSGWQAEVKGQTQSDGSFLAFLVNSDNGA